MGLRCPLRRRRGILIGRLWYPGVSAMHWCGDCVFEAWVRCVSVGMGNIFDGWG